MEKILTVNQVAEILSVQPITVREMFREKRLRAFKVGKAWRTTETMLREDIEAMARGAAVARPEAVDGPTGGDEPMATPKRPAKRPAKKKDAPQHEYTEQTDKTRATGYPDTRTGASEPAHADPAAVTGAPDESDRAPSQDTTDPKWMAPAGKLDRHPDIARDSDDDSGTPVTTATKIMNQQEQISGARQAETQIPPESEREKSAPPAEEKKPKKKKTESQDQDLFPFDEME